ncbi:hypothetical protein HGRIS_009425 [Hohenbuehelia grisea]|uniref:Cytochrome P450 n=1 Tax=Hohenbuehelia grisea TaxID=104357 RepID=A0ABR3J1D0_9AGAR
MISSILGVLVFFAGVWLWRFVWKPRRIAPLPPSPPADPLIGHLRVMPTDNQGEVFHDWAKKYGDVVYVNILGQSIVILDSVKAAEDLLEKRGLIYSDRPTFAVFDLMGWYASLAFMPYGKRFQKHRKLLGSQFTSDASLLWRETQAKNAHQLAKSMIEHKGDHEKMLNWFTTALVTKIAYGFDIKKEGDEYMEISQQNQYLLNNSGTPGATPVDLFPILKYLPDWFPGAYYADFARKGRPTVNAMYDWPYDKVVQALAEGDETPSVIRTLVKQLQQQETSTIEDVEDIKGIGANIFVGGAQSTWSTIVIFLLTMILNPDVQKRAQAEIDSVIGTDRLPEFSDWSSLPYVECVVQEVFRWFPVIPLGIPHRCTEDDVYRGMLIPKGAVVIPNARGMSLDENTYKNPTAFNPSRFLPKPEGNGEPFFTSAFGFGRRICPGRFMGLNGLWIVIATILATANVTRAVDEEGNEIEFEVEFMNGLDNRPKPFPCAITSRSAHASDVLARTVELEH